MTLRSEVSRAEGSTQGCRALRLDSSVSVHQPPGLDSGSHMGPCRAAAAGGLPPLRTGFYTRIQLEWTVFEGKATQ